MKSAVPRSQRTSRTRDCWPQLVLMNLWCYSLLLLWTLCGMLVFPFAFALCLLFTRRSADRLVRWFIWLYGRGWMLLMFPFVRFRREQLEQLEVGKPYLLVINHLSFFDTYCMAMLPVHDITFAVRSWPFRMFWYSGFMRLARYPVSYTHLTLPTTPYV